MRAKDLKGYILILIFFLLCFVGVTALYQFGVNDAINDNGIHQAESYFETTVADIDGAIAKEQNITHTACTVTNTAIFGDKSYAIASASAAEGSGAGYNVYYKKGDSFEKVSLSSILEKIDANENHVIMLVSSEGTIVGKNAYAETITNFLEVLTRTNGNQKSTSILDAAKNKSAYTSSAKLTVGSGSVKNGYITVGEYSSLGLVRFVDDASIASSKDLQGLGIAYLIGMVIVLVGATLTVVFMIKKSVKSGGMDSGISLRGANIVLICKANGKITKYNKAFRIAFPNHEVPIQTLADLKLIGTEDSLDSIIKEQRNFRACYILEENLEEGKPGCEIYFEFFALKRSSDYSIVGRDITEEYRHEQVLINTSTKSNVTGDDNAVVLGKVYDEVKAKFKAVNDPYTLIMVNLKGFKDINTLLGFEQGNDVLCFFSDMLHKSFEGLEVFHIQADEFALVDRNGEEQKDMALIDKFLDSLRAPIQINNNEIMLRPAFGIVGSDMDGATDCDSTGVLSKLIVATDKAKGAAGKTVCKYDVNLENSAQKDREMEEDLKNAISKGEFVMFYQPQYEINQERVCGFEALLRWNNPKYASISPEVYIKLAEKNGFIIDVGNFINADVFKTAKEMEPYDIHISVNVSPAQIVQAGFVADFLEKFEKNGLKPGAIALEVTETFLMENFNSVIEKLQILKNRGISIHLDDFGTGYSSMLYLKELPIDTIKVDKEFIKHIETDRFSKVLTSKIITLAKELGDKVICEGVETKVQKDIVGKFGADIIQGYYIGKALSKEDAFTLLKTGKVSSENKTNGRQGE